jgi:predicted membrane-bound mannosyltransferase
VHLFIGNVPKKSSDAPGQKKMIFRAVMATRAEAGTGMGGRWKYLLISLAFSALLALVYYRELWILHDAGGNISGAIEGMFTILISLVFAIVGVYLIVLVLHPHFSKRPEPASLKKIRDNVGEDTSREEIIDLLSDLECDKEVKEYMNTIGVKADIAITLAIALVAFFFGVFGYLMAFTIEYSSNPDIPMVSFCFMFNIFSCVFTILKTMKVAWDV